MQAATWEDSVCSANMSGAQFVLRIVQDAKVGINRLIPYLAAHPDQPVRTRLLAVQKIAIRP